MKLVEMVWKRLLTAGFAVVFSVCLAGTVFAEALVIGSNVSGVKVGTLLSKAQVVKVGDGQTLRLMLPSGRTKVIKGPASAEVAVLTRNQTRNEKIWKTVLASLKTKGGSSSDRIGAVRGMSVAPKPVAKVATLSFNAVPLNDGGTVCVVQGGDVALVRRGSGTAGDVTVFNAKAGTKAKVSFAAGQARVAWPDDLPLVDGHYAIIAAGAPMRQVSLRVLDGVPGDESMLSDLAERGCVAQTAQYLATLK
ncbi:MAG: hypothetical protein AAFV45_10615 [Pseudomonadota bacterium]